MSTKTPEQMAEEYVEAEFKGHGGPSARTLCRLDFLAGYQAAKQKPAVAIEDHTGDGRSCCTWCSEVAFRDGYRTAKEEK